MNYFRDVNPVNISDYSKRVDPDSKSRHLYDDLSKSLLGERTLPNGNKIKAYNVVLVANDKDKYYETRAWIISPQGTLLYMGLGTDYIGPSIYWAQEAKLTNDDISNFIDKCRVLGGHIFFPRWIKKYETNEFLRKLSINNAKGGEKGFYDRFDLLLYDLKLWYSSNPACKLTDVYEKNRDWLIQFVSFNGFIDFFHLNNYVVNGDVINLTAGKIESGSISFLSSNLSSVPKERSAYIEYSNYCCSLITSRNVLL